MDLLGTFLDFKIYENSPHYGLINKDTPPEQNYHKFYDFYEYSPVEKFWVQKLFQRFAPTVFTFYKSDAAIIRDHTVNLNVKENQTLPKCRAIPLNGDKLTAAHKLVRDMEAKGLAKISKDALAVSPSFVVFKNSSEKIKALKGAKYYEFRLVINYQELSKCIDTESDNSISYISSVSENLLVMANRQFKCKRP